jgi:hypothetical protein
MTACGLPILAAAAQLLQGIDAGGVQQTIMRGLATDIGDDQRLRHQIGEVIRDRRRGSCHGNRRVEQEISGKHGKVAQHPRLRLRQQVIAPIERRAQRLVPRQRRPPAGGQKFEPVIQQRGDLRRPHHDGVGRGEFDRERDAVQSPADRGNGAEVLLVAFEIRA